MSGRREVDGALRRAADRPDLLHLRGRLRGDDRRRAHLPDRRLDPGRGRRTPARRMLDAGIPDLLFERFAPRSSGTRRGTTAACSRSCSAAASTSPRPTRCSREHGHDDLRFLDNGAIARPDRGGRRSLTPTTWFPAGRARRRGSPSTCGPRLRARGLHRDRRLDRGPRVGGVRRALLLRRQRARARRRRCARRSRGFPNATVTEGAMGDGFYEAVVSTLAMRAILAANIGSRWLSDHATVAEEEYLQIMFWLEEAGLPITGANIARAMQLSPPTVHEMIGRLERDGYVSRADDKSLGFTDDGRDHAQAIVRRHRLIERFLTDVLGIPWDEVHEEAERLEHAMSPVLEERMLAAIGDATTCPHGHPIVEGAREQGVLLADVEPGRRGHRAAVRERGRGAAALPQGDRAAPGPRRQRSRARTTTRSSSPPTTGATRSRAASPRRSRSAPSRRRRRGPRCPRRWCSPATATGAERG